MLVCSRLSVFDCFVIICSFKGNWIWVHTEITPMAILILFGLLCHLGTNISFRKWFVNNYFIPSDYFMFCNFWELIYLAAIWHRSWLTLIGTTLVLGLCQPIICIWWSVLKVKAFIKVSCSGLGRLSWAHLLQFELWTGWFCVSNLPFFKLHGTHMGTIPACIFAIGFMMKIVC